ncbi:malto-oligosyltrehalose synthase [Streptomyces cavernae]|uniref:malto-oligosyltrehalose synthase n=1 Tax=Streptomyces cavernae TaxID=2259034 RepID=UPI000FEC17DB|nr:malto-oligosyltrehalose synthase [Streptomyces cavernae]
MTPDPVIPTATYRLQLQPAFPFAAAEAAVPYLASLGISHLHLSPVLEAVPGSAHGYDVVDHARVRGELGGEEGLRALAATARAHGLGLVVDIVPNHMAMSPRHNQALREVLRAGPESPYARWFDVDWEAQGGKLLLPVLGGPVGQELDRFEVDAEHGELRYYEHTFPLREGTEKLPLPELLDAQWYRPVWWRLARTELNYRRFFSISELIGVRVEDPEVFEATHRKVLELLADGVIQGLRVDHPDGLADPDAYLRRLHEATGGRWTVVEKILADGEPLPASWPVAGTTGYDALRHVDGLFVDPAGAGELLGQYRRFTAPPPDRGGHWEATVRRAAYKVIGHELATELDRLTRTASLLCAADLALRDRAPWALRTALVELLVRMEVYRPYASTDASAVVTEEAAAEARRAFAVPEEADAVDVVRDLVLGRAEDSAEHRAFRARFAQTSSALRAKSVEDTAFYRYVPLLSATEVGGEPGRPAVSPEEFHGYCARVQRDWPVTGTVLSTHDTKRSADVRAAISVLSQCPQRWGEVIGEPGADPLVMWAARQTEFGLGHFDEERIRGFLLKHVRESGLRTSWTEQDGGYEASVTASVVEEPRVAGLRGELEPHVRANVLGAALVQLTMPGVPDLYQGTEDEYRALVDPDNRRPFAPPEDPAEASAERSAKAALTTAALRLRRERPGLFGDRATYTPLTAEGPAAAHCVAFARSEEVVTAVTRLSLRLAEAGGWRDTGLPLPPGRWSDLLSPGREFEERVRLAELFGSLPVALLVREG